VKSPLASMDDLLRAARNAAEPDAEEGPRVWRRLSLPLAAPVARLPGAASGLARRARLSKLGLLTVAAGGIFVAGFLLGRASSTAAGAAAALGDAPLAALDAELPTPSSAPNVAAVPSEQHGAAGAAGEPGSELSRLTFAQKATSQRTGSADSLREVLRRLRAAQRALRVGDGARALGILGELDRRVSPALLAEERQVTRVLALCSAQQPEQAGALARRVLAEYPRSVYTSRLQHSCAELEGDAGLLDEIRRRVRE